MGSCWVGADSRAAPDLEVTKFFAIRQKEESGYILCHVIGK